MGDTPGAEGIVCWLQGSLFQVDKSEIVMHEGDEPDSLVELIFLPCRQRRPQAVMSTSRSWNG